MRIILSAAGYPRAQVSRGNGHWMSLVFTGSCFSLLHLENVALNKLELCVAQDSMFTKDSNSSRMTLAKSMLEASAQHCIH